MCFLCFFEHNIKPFKLEKNFTVSLTDKQGVVSRKVQFKSSFVVNRQLKMNGNRGPQAEKLVVVNQ